VAVAKDLGTLGAFMHCKESVTCCIMNSNNSEPLGCKAVNVPLRDLHAIGDQVTQMHSLISFHATTIKSDTLPGLFTPQTKHEKLSQVLHEIFIEEYGSPC
jgi:hypothetical protein